VDLQWIREAMATGPEAFARIWRLQDGVPGLPLRRYDWSAIRDSSDHAVKLMLAEAARSLSRRELLVRLGIEDR
jgi:hypothetical protein